MPRLPVRVVVCALFVAGWTSIAACSGCEEDVTDEHTGADTGLDTGSVDDTGETSREDADDETGDTQIDGDSTSDAGAEDDVEETDAGQDDEDDDTCPLSYQRECDGECVSTNTDIDHCGECDNECEGDEACVGGECTTECMGDLQLCDNRCVDTAVDNDHCGQCDNPCDQDQGCSDNDCVDTADLGPAPDECEAGGPPIDVDFGDGEVDECTGEIAESTFMWALCTCGDLTTQDEFLTDGFDSTSGPYQPGGLGGGVGVNGEFRTESEAEVWGAVHVGEPSSVDIGDTTDIRQQFHAGGDVHAGGACAVGDDAYIAGDISGDGLDVSGTLFHPEDAARPDGITYGNLAEQPVTVSPPCRCEDEDQIPIDDLVAAGQSPDNDNELIGLDEDLMTGSDTPEHIELPCGKYYLSEIDADGDVTIVAEGRVVLYVDGDINHQGELTLTPGPEGEFDIFVSGNIHSDSGLSLGSLNHPASTRLYIGGDDGMTLSGESDIGGNIYAVPGTLMIEDEIDIYGALYARDAIFESELSIHYDRHVIRTGDACPTPDDDDDNGDNGDDNGDNGDDNGDDEPVCVQEGDSCENDDDCCAPLICDEQTETCSLMECRPLGDPCYYNDQCCSGICAGASGDDEGSCISG